MPTNPGELGEAQAIELARVYVKRVGPFVREVWEREHGSRIDLARLAPCGGALYAASPYEQPVDADPAVRHLLGGQWLVEFCSGPTHAVSVAVSAAATDVSITERDHLAGPLANAFTPFGIPPVAAAGALTADGAARAASRATGRRVAAVPVLVRPARPYAPQLAKWHVRLDAPVSLRDVQRGTSTAARDVYVGFGDRWSTVGLFTAAAAAPEAPVLSVVGAAQAGAVSSRAPAVSANPGYLPVAHSEHPTAYARMEVRP